MSEESYQKIFSKNLNYYMSLNGKSQSDLVNDLGFNKSAVSTWCNGTRLPRMDKVELLAQYFNINRSDLIEEKNLKQNIIWMMKQQKRLKKFLKIKNFECCLMSPEMQTQRI